jgi:hypothetical protein
MATRIIVEGLEELQARFAEFPDKLHGLMNKALEASLYSIWESEPGYPPPPEESGYTRTGQLGRSLGISEGGGQEGKPDIFEVHGYESAEFGTNLYYGPYVIGDPQAYESEGRFAHWWKLTVDVLNDALPKIQQVFETMAEHAAAWLDKGI